MPSKRKSIARQSTDIDLGYGPEGTRYYADKHPFLDSYILYADGTPISGPTSLESLKAAVVPLIKKNPLFRRPVRKAVPLSEIRELQEEEAKSLCSHLDFTGAKRTIKQRPASYARARGLRIEGKDETAERDSLLKELKERGDKAMKKLARGKANPLHESEAKDSEHYGYYIPGMSGRATVSPVNGFGYGWEVTGKTAEGVYFTRGFRSLEDARAAAKRVAKGGNVEPDKRRKNPLASMAQKDMIRQQLKRLHVGERFSGADAYDKVRDAKNKFRSVTQWLDSLTYAEAMDLPGYLMDERPRTGNPDERYWIQGTIKRPGALHRKLGVPEDRDIPAKLLNEAINHPERFERTHAAQIRLKREAVEARTLKGLGYKKRALSGTRRRNSIIDAIADPENAERLMSEQGKDYDRAAHEANLARIAAERALHPGVDSWRFFTPTPKKNLRRGARRNPEATLAGADELYESFHGEPPHRIGTFSVPVSIPSDLAQLGKLIKIKIVGSGRMLQQLTWKRDEGVSLAADPVTQSLYIVGRNQRLPQNVLDEMERNWGDAASKNQFIIGTIKEITYEAQKEFDKFEKIDYFHELGEETGERPLLVYDRHNHRLLIVGGAYTVKPEGITN